MGRHSIKIDFGNVGTGRKETTPRMYNNPLIKLVKLLNGAFTFDENYCYITIPFDDFYKYLDTWERTLCRTINQKRY